MEGIKSRGSITIETLTMDAHQSDGDINLVIDWNLCGTMSGWAGVI